MFLQRVTFVRVSRSGYYFSILSKNASISPFTKDMSSFQQMKFYLFNMRSLSMEDIPYVSSR